MTKQTDGLAELPEPVKEVFVKAGRNGTPTTRRPFYDYYTADQMRAYATQAVEASAVPEGWKLVPVNPTLEMMEAAKPALQQVNDILTAHQIRSGQTVELFVDGSPPLWHAYKAMLAAAPPMKGKG